MLEILTRICEGKGTLRDLDLLEELAYTATQASLCELGKTAANPVLSTLKYFRDEYEEHINNKHCPAGACKELITFRILPEKCKGCGICAKACPAQCIDGVLKSPYEIRALDCIKCGTCKEKCPFDAIVTE